MRGWVGVATLIFDGLMARIIFLSSSVSTGGRYFTPFFDLKTDKKGHKSTKNITLCEKTSIFVMVVTYIFCTFVSDL